MIMIIVFATLITTIKWIEMSNLFITFFYFDTFLEAMQEKINDPEQVLFSKHDTFFDTLFLCTKFHN
jgi:hypothetical protein